MLSLKLIFSCDFCLQSTQVELVLLIFRRLAEDIHLFDSGLTPRRKREMATALSEQARTVFAFLISNLEVHVYVVVTGRKCTYIISSTFRPLFFLLHMVVTLS